MQFRIFDLFSLENFYLSVGLECKGRAKGVRLLVRVVWWSVSFCLSWSNWKLPPWFPLRWEDSPAATLFRPSLYMEMFFFVKGSCPLVCVTTFVWVLALRTSKSAPPQLPPPLKFHPPEQVYPPGFPSTNPGEENINTEMKVFKL